MIYYLSPYSINRNIGGEYNSQIATLPDYCWIVLRDHDTLLFPETGNRIPEIIESNPEYSLFTSMTNRVGVGLHCVPGMFDDDSILSHQNKSGELWDKFVTSTMETGVAPGFCMIFKKSLWEEVGGFTENSIFFDREFSNAVKSKGYKIGLCLGLYILHLYRYPDKTPRSNIKHLLP